MDWIYVSRLFQLMQKPHTDKIMEKYFKQFGYTLKRI